MRIIGGKLKGKVILPPAGYQARPTTDFAKEGLFNILDNEYEFEDLKVLDLFGGTGSIAFEFASRGAARVYCVEMARENASFIKTEAQRLGLDNVTMVRDNVFEAPDFTTAQYFLFLSMRRLQLNPEVSTVCFRTPLDPEAEMSLYRYFKGVVQL